MKEASYLVFGLQQFQGNRDSNTIVRHYVPRPAMVKSVHIIPIEWKTNFAIRLELYGCIAGGYIISYAYGQDIKRISSIGEGCGALKFQILRAFRFM